MLCCFRDVWCCWCELNLCVLRVCLHLMEFLLLLLCCDIGHKSMHVTGMCVVLWSGHNLMRRLTLL